MSCLRCLVWEYFRIGGERLQSGRPGRQYLHFVSLMAIDLAHSSFRSSSTMDPFITTAFYVSTGLSYPIIPTTAMISFFLRTLLHRFSSRSRSSGHRLASIRPRRSPSLSPIRYRAKCFDISVSSDWTNQISLLWSMLEERKSAIRMNSKSFRL